MAALVLYFSGGRSLRLCRLDCRFGRHRLTVNSYSSEFFKVGDGSFRWSKAVRALSALAVRVILAARTSSVEPRLMGPRGSPAAALDGALSKEPRWIIESFGQLSTGVPLCRRIFRRSNPGMRRMGPVAVSFSPLLTAAHIVVMLDGEQVTCVKKLLWMLDELEEGGRK